MKRFENSNKKLYNITFPSNQRNIKVKGELKFEAAVTNQFQIIRAMINNYNNIILAHFLPKNSIS